MEHHVTENAMGVGVDLTPAGDATKEATAVDLLGATFSVEFALPGEAALLHPRIEVGRTRLVPIRKRNEQSFLSIALRPLFFSLPIFSETSILVGPGLIFPNGLLEDRSSAIESVYLDYYLGIRVTPNSWRAANGSWIGVDVFFKTLPKSFPLSDSSERGGSFGLALIGTF